jgi:hypothetical protein
MQQAVELDAATRERERLARGIHDGVLQVLALVQRRGAELGGEGAELGRLAGEQEAALRSLVGMDVAPMTTGGLVDLRGLLRPVDGARVHLVTSADPVVLPAGTAAEVAAAVGSALDNVRAHAGTGATAWVLVEDEPDCVTVTVRDDGRGMAPGRVRGSRGRPAGDRPIHLRPHSRPGRRGHDHHGAAARRGAGDAGTAPPRPAVAPPASGESVGCAS